MHANGQEAGHKSLGTFQTSQTYQKYRLRVVGVCHTNLIRGRYANSSAVSTARGSDRLLVSLITGPTLSTYSATKPRTMRNALRVLIDLTRES